MTSNRISRILALAIGLMVVVLASGFLSGCGEQPLGPTNESIRPDQPTAAGGGKRDDKFSTKIVKRDIKELTKLVGPQGDSLVICLDGRGRGRKTGFVLPPAAVLHATAIQMRVTKCDFRVSGMIYEYDFGPDGLEFVIPCTLFLELAGRDGTLLTLWWYNPETLDWEAQRTEELSNGRVSFRAVNHFSKYGITCRGGGSSS